MSLDWLPKAGSITEKKYADFFAGAMPLGRLRVRQNGIIGAVGFPLYCSGLTLGIKTDGASFYAELHGYAITLSSDSDLTLAVPANSGVYVYLALDMAGGGTNTVGQRLVYSSTPGYLPHSLLLAFVATNATAVVSITYACQTGRLENIVYPEDYGDTWYPFPTLSSSTELSTSSTTAVLAKQFRVENPGVYNVAVDIKRTTTGTGTVEIYCDSTGLSSPQLTFTTTSSTYARKTGTLTCNTGDTIHVYHKMSTASGTMFTEDVILGGYYGIPIAPAFLLK